jgi:hypothetical protein
MVHLFKENFTPLFKVGCSSKVLEEDLLNIKFCHVARGPKGHCFSRSKHFTHYMGDRDLKFHQFRLIFNREKLKQRYRIHPFDEYYLSKTLDPKKGWYGNHGKHFHKAVFPMRKNSDGEILRQPRHGLKNVDFSQCSMEQEFEERILCNIPNLGRFIYAINFWDYKGDYVYNSPIIRNYMLKYPHIKLLSGYDNFEDKTDSFLKLNSLSEQSIIYN